MVIQYKVLLVRLLTACIAYHYDSNILKRNENDLNSYEAYESVSQYGQVRNLQIHRLSEHCCESH